MIKWPLFGTLFLFYCKVVRLKFWNVVELQFYFHSTLALLICYIVFKIGKKTFTDHLRWRLTNLHILRLEHPSNKVMHLPFDFLRGAQKEVDFKNNISCPNFRPKNTSVIRLATKVEKDLPCFCPWVKVFGFGIYQMEKKRVTRAWKSQPLP